MLLSSSKLIENKSIQSMIPRSKSITLDTCPKLYLIEIPSRKVAFINDDCLHNTTMNNQMEDDNPFRPGSELSREADIIVNLIKEGKPITPTGDLSSNNNNNNNNNNVNDISNNNSQITTPKHQQQQQQQLKEQQEENFTKKNQQQIQTILVKNENNNNNVNVNNNNKVEPGQIEVQHGIIVSSSNNNQNQNNKITVEEINLKKKRKCCSLI